MVMEPQGMATQICPVRSGQLTTRTGLSLKGWAAPVRPIYTLAGGAVQAAALDGKQLCGQVGRQASSSRHAWGALDNVSAVHAAMLASLEKQNAGKRASTHAGICHTMRLNAAKSPLLTLERIRGM